MGYGAIIGQTPTVQASAEMTSYNNDNTSSVITADNVQGAIDQLFTSVSNGKSQIASAITDMGVSTSANDSFAQMATNIGNIETGYDTSQVTATAATVRSGYKFVNSSGQLITGTIPSKGAQTYTPKTVSQTISSGQYLSGNQTIQGDGNLVASNIKSGVSIFGVSGSYTGTGNIAIIPIDGISFDSYSLGIGIDFSNTPYTSNQVKEIVAIGISWFRRKLGSNPYGINYFMSWNNNGVLSPGVISAIPEEDYSLWTAGERVQISIDSNNISYERLNSTAGIINITWDSPQMPYYSAANSSYGYGCFVVVKL